jgi:addiction module HigA family antidote
MIPKKRIPTHPGEVLLYEFLIPMKISQSELARKLKVPVQRVNTIINKRRGISAETAILLSKKFKTSPEFWLNLQNTYDLFLAKQRLKRAA